jgi:hypothetical protein
MKTKLFHINRFHGRSIRFRNGFAIGFNWTHGNGSTTKTSAIIAGYHPPQSITWRWALYWNRPQKLFQFSASKRSRRYGYFGITLPLIGGFKLNWQPYMWRKTNERDAA